ncbi:MAG TPA: YbjN domain-containing protein [Haliangiales bacterium]|nr:YbjN domain-containing protein [Haliangiales bacterium]
MPVERVANYQDLCALLEQEKVQFQKDEADLVATMAIQIEGFASTLYLRWEPNLPYCQAVCPVHLNVPDDRVAAMESVCARLNHAIALPGFGFDHEKKYIYFRLTIPIEPGGMDAKFFGLMARACVNNATDFARAVSAVVHGDPPEGALAAAIAHRQGKAAPTPGYQE